jgi:hypothetical protein
MRSFYSAAILAIVMLASASAFANSGELLNFQYLGNFQQVGNFYNGGPITALPSRQISTD